MTENSNGVVILITLLNILVYKLRKLEESHKQKHLALSVRPSCRRFSLGEMQSATNKFSEELVIGKGGYGIVYKGIIDFKDRIVAMKRSKSMSKQGRKGFLTEIEMLSQFQHSHLVSLIGYCDENEEMILVYSYMSSGSLADHLHKRVRKGETSLPFLSWVQRLKICIGAAQGLNYLHTGTGIDNRVIHRDVKTSNILLDENLAAKLSDFGLSIRGPANQTCTYVSSRVRGTPGYLDPSYLDTHRITRKADVYSFGVVLFEVLCGRPALDQSLDEEQINLAKWAQHCFKEGLLGEITDPKIKGDISSDSLSTYVDVAVKCLHNQPKLRPTMAEVVVSLESALTLQEKSTHYTQVKIISTDYSQEYMDSSMLDLKSTNHNKQEHEFTGKGIVNVSNDWHRNNQFTTRKTFIKRVGSLFSVTTWALTGNKDAKRSRCGNDLLPFYRKPARFRRQNVLQSPRLKRFKLNDLIVGTRNFHSTNLIGQGGLGDVFKCWINEYTFAAAKWGTGRAIAVKRFNQKSSQGHLEWLREINYLGTLCHPNIVRVIGYCSEKEHRLIVYEFMSQGSLDRHLHMRDDSAFQPLSWNLRISIAIGAAKGIAYLHSPEARVDYNAKLFDFWMAREGPGPDYSHLSTDVYGTSVGHVTMKSDIFSYGVVLLEILTGRRAIDPNLPKEEMFLFPWVLPYLTSNCNVVDIMDKRIKGQYTVKAVLRVSSLALKCLSLDPISRPEAKQVVKELEEIQQRDNSGIIRRQEDVLQSPTLKSFTFHALNLATRKFHSDVQLGNHQYGQVYKGWINEHTFAAAKWGTGRAIAVMRLNQKRSRLQKWLTEIDYLDTLSHPNIVKVIGYCFEKKHRLIVYEFMSQGSFYGHLHMRNDSDFQPLSWNLRISIALGAAKGIAYLHSPEARVIHRDISSANILLDSNYNAKLSGFWMACAREGPGPDYSHLCTVHFGTIGYLDPHYFKVGHATMKSDIYSYGVVLLEILTGRSIYMNLQDGEECVVSWAMPYLTSNCNVVDIMDKRIEGQYTVEAGLRVSSLVHKCVSEDPKSRPEAKEVVKVLEEVQHMENTAGGSQGMNQDATSAINEWPEWETFE